MPEVIDKRRGKWEVIIENEKCPHLYYPRSDISCRLLEHKEDDYCYKKNCSCLAQAIHSLIKEKL